MTVTPSSYKPIFSPEHEQSHAMTKKFEPKIAPAQNCRHTDAIPIVFFGLFCSQMPEVRTLQKLGSRLDLCMSERAQTSDLCFSSTNAVRSQDSRREGIDGTSRAAFDTGLRRSPATSIIFSCRFWTTSICASRISYRSTSSSLIIDLI